MQQYGSTAMTLAYAGGTGARGCSVAHGGALLLASGAHTGHSVRAIICGMVVDAGDGNNRGCGESTGFSVRCQWAGASRLWRFCSTCIASCGSMGEGSYFAMLRTVHRFLWGLVKAYLVCITVAVITSVQKTEWALPRV